MPYIPYVNYENLCENARSLFDEQIQTNGKVTNMKKTLLHSVNSFVAYQKWYPLKVDIVAFIGERGTILFSHSISSENDCLLCSTFFRKLLIENGEDPENLNLNEKETVLKEFGRLISKSPNTIPQEFYKKLDSFFTKDELVKLVAFAGIMAATNLFNNVLKVELDDYLEGFQKRSE